MDDEKDNLNKKAANQENNSEKEDDEGDFNLLDYIEEVVYNGLMELGFLIQDFPNLVVALMSFCAKLHISLGGNKKAFIQMSREVYSHLLTHKKEIQEEFQEFLENCTGDPDDIDEDDLCPECRKELEKELEEKKKLN